MSLPEETMVKLAENHYFWVIEREQSHQDTIFRIYLTVSALVLGYGPIIIDRNNSVQSSHFSILCLSISILLSCITIIFCIFNMRGRCDYKFPNITKFTKIMNNYYYDSWKYENIQNLIESYMEYSELGKKEMNRRAKILRITSWILTISFTFVLLSWASALHQKIGQSFMEVMRYVR